MKTTTDHRFLVRCLLLALTLAAASTVAQAQDVDSLIARHIEARGGMEQLEAIETLRMSGRAVAGPGQEALVSLEVRPPSRIRTEFAFQGVTAVYACADSECWSVSPMSGSFEAVPMSESDASQEMEQANLLGPLVDWKAKGHSVELVGTEPVDGREAHKLKVTLKSGAVQTHYLDVESALLVRREVTRTFGDRPIELQTTFSDFRPVGGVVFPHLIRSSAKGRPGSLEVVVEAAELNGPVDDSRFEMPG